MQLSDIFCYAVLTISVTATCVGAEQQENEVVESKRTIHLNKRDATMIIDNFPMESMYQKPKVVYRKVSRISKHRYGPPKPIYGPPRPKYGPPKITRKPGKKYNRKTSNPKRRPHVYTKRTTKPKYGSPKHPKPGYGRPSRVPHYPVNIPASAGFGEPPLNIDEYEKSKQNEPPVDSYGAAIKTNLRDLYPSIQSMKPGNHFEKILFADFDQEYQSWKNFQREQNADSINEYSKIHPVYKKPESDIFVTPITMDNEEKDTSDTYSEISTYKENKQLKEQKNKKPFFPKNVKFVNRPWKAQKQDLDEEIIVGGQYAEPPARYMHKFQSNAQIFDNDEFAPPQSFIDSEIPSSATNSPYVNYKNSNVAFNPQNLNDAFSIVN